VSRKAPRVRIPPSPPITGGRGDVFPLYPPFSVLRLSLEPGTYTCQGRALRLLVTRSPVLYPASGRVPFAPGCLPRAILLIIGYQAIIFFIHQGR
jgi:hypothetical protein